MESGSVSESLQENSETFPTQSDGDSVSVGKKKRNNFHLPGTFTDTYDKRAEKWPKVFPKKTRSVRMNLLRKVFSMIIFNSLAFLCQFNGHGASV